MKGLFFKLDTIRAVYMSLNKLCVFATLRPLRLLSMHINGD